ncbi:MAG: hypothetical protein IPL47_17345 [Phyllobacteriaceae bacterium]|nr:hypothetical protein [Phyllobacteriaceae bacterium]
MKAKTTIPTPKGSAAPAAPADLFQITNAESLGRLIHEWAINRAKAPRTIGELRQQTSGVMTVPARLPNDMPIDIVQSDHAHYVLELPDVKMFEKGKVEISQLGTMDEYPVPDYFNKKGHCVQGQIKMNNPAVGHVPFLYTRLADYTFSVCR